MSFETTVYFRGHKIECPLFVSGLSDDDEVAADQLLQGNRISSLSEALSPSPRSLEGLQNGSLNEYYSTTTVVDSNETLLAYMRKVVEELSLLRKLYYQCLQAKKIKTSDLPTIYELLMFATEYYDKATTLKVSNQTVPSDVTYTVTQSITWPDANHANNTANTNIASNLVSLFQRFRMSADEKYAQYTIASKGSDTARFVINYWNNIHCQVDLRADLWSFASRCYLEESNASSKILKEFDIAAISDTFLAVVHNTISDILSNESEFVLERYPSRLLQLNAKSHRAVELLFLYLDILDSADYRACKMCGRLFFVGSQKTKIYCDRHTKNAKHYFNRRHKNLIAGVKDDISIL